MNIYKQASRLKLKFNTEKGPLSVNQLWDCSRAMLGRTIQSVNDILKEQTPTGDLDFLNDGTTVTVDPENQLRFDILKDIYITKKEEAEALRDKEAVKQHNAKIDTIIARKQDEELENMSLEDLNKMRK